MNWSALTILWTVCAPLAGAGPIATDRVEVVDFTCGARTVQGGLYHAAGASPRLVWDRVVEPNAADPGHWRIDVAADAPPSRVGGVVPLFADHVGNSQPKLLNAGGIEAVHVRLRGALGGRVLKVEVVPGIVTVPARWGAVAGTVAPAEVSADAFRTFSFPLPQEGLDVSSLGALRLMLEGDGEAWIAVDAIWLGASGDRAAPRTRPATGHRLRRAMWVWKTGEILPDAERVAALLAFCGKHGVTDIYLQIPYAYRDGKVEMTLASEQRSFNAAAHRAGIVVHALDGAPDFIFEKNHPRMLALVAALVAFNAESPRESRYPAIHLDNEPYVLPEWKVDAKRQVVLRDYLALNRKLRKLTADAGLEFGVDIPFWWDDPAADGSARFQVDTPAGRVPLLEALFPLVDNVGIMSYRERATGRDGVIGSCVGEFALGARLGVAVFASVELGTDVEPGISMGRFPLPYFEAQLETLQNTLKHMPGCAGIAIHYYSHYKSWEESS